MSALISARELNYKLDELASVLSREQIKSYTGILFKEAILLKEKLNQPLVISFVGEFSSGKSSLINSMLGKKILKTDINPSTATITQIFFSQGEEYVEYYDGEDNLIKKIYGIDGIEDNAPENTVHIKVFTNIDKYPSTVSLVDTPGISSLDERHREVLFNFINRSDVFFVVVDINQGTLTENTVKLIGTLKKFSKKFYAILTKADLKPPSEVDEVREFFSQEYIKKGKLVEEVLVSSAEDGDIDDVIKVISDIDSIRESILIDRIKAGFNSLCSRSVKQLTEHKASIKSEKLYSKIDLINSHIKILKTTKIEVREFALSGVNTILDGRVNIEIKPSFVDRLFDLIKNKEREKAQEKLQEYFSSQIDMIISNTYMDLNKFLQTDFTRYLNNIMEDINTDSSSILRAGSVEAESLYQEQLNNLTLDFNKVVFNFSFSDIVSKVDFSQLSAMGTAAMTALGKIDKNKIPEYIGKIKNNKRDIAVGVLSIIAIVVGGVFLTRKYQKEAKESLHNELQEKALQTQHQIATLLRNDIMEKIDGLLDSVYSVIDENLESIKSEYQRLMEKRDEIEMIEHEIDLAINEIKALSYGEVA